VTDQIVDAAMARSLYQDSLRTHVLAAWLVLHDDPHYPGRFVARLVAAGPSPYVLMADTLAQLQAQLPPDMVRAERQPADPPGVLEVWYSARL
jgi:hypothetical protein